MGSQAAAQLVVVPNLQSTVPTVDVGAGSLPVFWIYIDDEGHWCLRKEGGATEATFGSRDAALAFVQDLAGNQPYRLFIETPDGRVIQEQHGAGLGVGASSAPPSQAGNGTDLGQRLEWARQLESAARTSPSRLSLLAELFHRTRS
jgi:hypothetical protein